MRSESKHLELNEEKWDRWARSLDDETWVNNYLRKAQRNLVSLLEVSENDSILDVGCGTGYALRQIAVSLNGKGRFYGVDLSQKMVDKAKKNFSGEANFDFIKANAESIPLESACFDVILCTHSFHHYLNPARALSEMERLLKPGGKVYVLDLTADNWWLRLTDKVTKTIEPQHVRMYSTKEFKELLSDSGLIYLETIDLGTRLFALHQKVHVAKKQQQRGSRLTDRVN